MFVCVWHKKWALVFDVEFKVEKVLFSPVYLKINSNWYLFQFYNRDFN